MNNIFLKINQWENSRSVECGLPLREGDLVIIETEEGTESAIVEKITTGAKKNILPGHKNENTGLKIIRKANLRDLNTIKEYRQKEIKALHACQEEVKKNGMPMKIIGASYSFDGGSIVFAFIADGRVDFRELVKSLSKKFQRSIRLHQIGARDEARASGGYGICGRELCCIRFKDNLPSISSDMAKAQHIVRRGSERISGLCGRLMCCLAYEADQYREMIDKLPRIGTEIKTKEGKGTVKDINALTGEIKVKLDDENIIQISVKDI